MFKSAVVGIFLLFTVIVFSGCTQTDNTTEQIIDVKGDTDKIEITGYTVITTWILYDLMGDGALYNHSGFYHGYPDDIYDASFDVDGKIKNIAAEHLDTIRITVLFCDANNKTLAMETTTLYNLSDTHTEVFHVSVTLIETMHFKNIDGVKFEVSVS